jgi:hypothetical protein
MRKEHTLMRKEHTLMRKEHTKDYPTIHSDNPIRESSTRTKLQSEFCCSRRLRFLRWRSGESMTRQACQLMRVNRSLARNFHGGATAPLNKSNANDSAIAESKRIPARTRRPRGVARIGVERDLGAVL